MEITADQATHVLLEEEDGGTRTFVAYIDASREIIEAAVADVVMTFGRHAHVELTLVDTHTGEDEAWVSVRPCEPLALQYAGILTDGQVQRREDVMSWALAPAS